MPADLEQLYGPPGPQNTMVLMDIISKMKQDLQQSRAENNKLSNQLNCLISLVKRSWSEEHGAVTHLANIVGMEPPRLEDTIGNTPMPEKSRAVKNWERLSIMLMERDNAAIQQEINYWQRTHIMSRQAYMNDLLDDHNKEMSKMNLHKNTSNIEDVDRSFLKYYTTAQKKNVDRGYLKGVRPKSSKTSLSRHQKPPPTAADMVEMTGMNLDDILGKNREPMQVHSYTDVNVFNQVPTQERRLYRPKQQYDDPNRYKQPYLYDPDSVNTPEETILISRPSSASTISTKSIPGKTCLRTRPVSAIITSGDRPERPLKYETTRPVSIKQRPKSASVNQVKSRPPSGNVRRAGPGIASKKSIHDLQTHFSTHGNSNGRIPENGSEVGDAWSSNYAELNTNVPYNHRQLAAGDDDQVTDSGYEKEKPPVFEPFVKTSESVETFVSELQQMDEKALEFKNATLQLQKRLGLDNEGLIY